MNPRDRAIAALEHRQADRIPTGENAVDFELAERILGRPTLANARWREMEALWDGRRSDVVSDYVSSLTDLARVLEWDYLRVPLAPRDEPRHRPVMTGPYSWLDDEGREIHFHPASGNIAVLSNAEPLSLDDLPDPDAPIEIDPSELEIARRVVRQVGDTRFIVGRAPDGTFPWQQCGSMEAFLVRMLTEPVFVERAVAVYVKRSIAYIEALLDAGCDAVMTCDDYCDNRGPIMGPDLFATFALPGLRRQVEAAHAKGGFFIKHTDGNTWAILDDLVDAGIDGWHGIQPAIGMDLGRLKKRYGDDICFFGGVNCETLVAGTPDETRAEVRYAIERAGMKGGLVLTCGNVLQPGTRLDNYIAQRKAVSHYGDPAPDPDTNAPDRASG